MIKEKLYSRDFENYYEYNILSKLNELNGEKIKLFKKRKLFVILSFLLLFTILLRCFFQNGFILGLYFLLSLIFYIWTVGIYKKNKNNFRKILIESSKDSFVSFFLYGTILIFIFDVFLFLQNSVVVVLVPTLITLTIYFYKFIFLTSYDGYISFFNNVVLSFIDDLQCVDYDSSADSVRIEEKQINKLKLFSFYKKVNIIDKFSKIYKGKHIKFYKLTTILVNDDLKYSFSSKRDTTGVLIQIPLNIKFKGKTVILIDESFENKETIKFENQLFSNSFKVYSTNEEEARIYVSPTLIKTLTSLCIEDYKEEINLSFEDGKLNILLENRHLNTYVFLNQSIGKKDCIESIENMYNLLEIIDNIAKIGD